jgi:hypothetical protein
MIYFLNDSNSREDLIVSKETQTRERCGDGGGWDVNVRNTSGKEHS